MGHGYDRDGAKIEKSTQTVLGPIALYNHVTATRSQSFKALLVRWIVYCHVAFAMLENEYLRDLLAC